jgi:hypothetical protein
MITNQGFKYVLFMFQVGTDGMRHFAGQNILPVLVIIAAVNAPK